MIDTESPCACRIQQDGVGGEGQPAAARHRVAGVDAQVHQHLLDLAGVGIDVADTRRRTEQQLDLGGNQMLDEAGGVFQQGIEVQDAAAQRLAAAEGDELFDELGAAVRTVQDALQIGGKLIQSAAAPCRCLRRQAR